MRLLLISHSIQYHSITVNSLQMCSISQRGDKINLSEFLFRTLFRLRLHYTAWGSIPNFSPDPGFLPGLFTLTFEMILMWHQCERISALKRLTCNQQHHTYACWNNNKKLRGRHVGEKNDSSANVHLLNDLLRRFDDNSSHVEGEKTKAHKSRSYSSISSCCWWFCGERGVGVAGRGIRSVWAAKCSQRNSSSKTLGYIPTSLLAPHSKVVTGGLKM